ncbi:MAG TPA: cob(I)yrinic acid a,c-diamide adenosyltransferase [Pseudobdellovibrionaceae bacterium]|nr:cob(I)yrinic acid a,c-diamide adenosyltransferase [Pseudobdellovibrionaceae bacterium]
MTTAPRSKIYTKKGDLGKTSLVDGSNVDKFHRRVEAYGTVDELNAFLGQFITQLNESPPPKDIQFKEILDLLNEIQSQLFNVGSLLACNDVQMISQLPQVSPASLERIEKCIDRLDAELIPLKNFILPQGHFLATSAHILRTVCRRAERQTNAVEAQDPSYPMVQAYLNRLSDFFFVLSRWLNHIHNISEKLWKAETP